MASIPQPAVATDGNMPTTSTPSPSAASINIEQLCAIDETIAELMSHASSALKALGDSSSVAAVDAPVVAEVDSASTFRPAAERLLAFQDATDAFLNALHSVDVRMKRQLWALEEADILRFPDDPSSDADQDPHEHEDETRAKLERASAKQHKEGVPHKVRASLAPDAKGSFGGLDVSWLNSRILSSAVQREMEAELWERAKVVLEQGEGGLGGENDGDREGQSDGDREGQNDGDDRRRGSHDGSFSRGGGGEEGGDADGVLHPEDRREDGRQDDDDLEME